MIKKVGYLALMVALVSAAAPMEARANLQQQMDQVFGSLVNTTNPQAYKGQRMGAFFGGSVYVRNRIVNTSIIGFVPPHISAGCGGIDMFGGSFSFINASQFQNLLRSIASNAGGYFFQIALQAMCPTCMEEISKLQNAVQKLNSLAGNSCMLGKAFVDAAATAIIPSNVDQKSVLGRLRNQAAADATTSTAAFTDTFDSLWPSNGSNKESKISAADPTFLKRKGYVGNVAWQLIQNSNVGTWIAFGDRNMKEAIMSMTGTIIIHDATTSVTTPGGGTDKSLSSTTLEPILTPEALIYGTRDGNVTMYQCDTTVDCLNPTKVNVTGFVDFTTRVQKILKGDATNIGLIAKYARGGNTLRFTASEKAFIENAPAPVMAMIRNLAQRGEKTAVYLTQFLAPWIAREMAYRFVSELVKAMQVAAGQAKPELQAKVQAFQKMLSSRVERRLFEMKRDSQETDNTLMYALQTYQNLRLQFLAKDRTSIRVKPDANGVKE